MMSTNEFIEKINSGEAKVLTVAAAEQLKGKHIYWMYFGYRHNENTVQEMTVGNIVSSLDYEETQPCNGYRSRADYWRSYMTAEKLDEEKTELILLDESGHNSSIYAHTKYSFFKEPTFTCSDADREVYFLLSDNL